MAKNCYRNKNNGKDTIDSDTQHKQTQRQRQRHMAQNKQKPHSIVCNCHEMSPVTVIQLQAFQSSSSSPPPLLLVLFCVCVYLFELMRSLWKFNFEPSAATHCSNQKGAHKAIKSRSRPIPLHIHRCGIISIEKWYNPYYTYKHTLLL